MADTAAPAAAPTATPASPAPSAATPAPAGAAPSSTPAPAGPAPASPTPAPQGEPPKERWADILQNARRKARAEAEQEYRQRYEKYDTFERDPWNAVQQWLSEASGHSLYGPMVKQWAGNYLRSLRGQAPAEEPAANVPILNAEGQVTGYTYDDAQLKAWQQWNQSRLMSQLEERLSPIEQREQQRRAYEEQQAAAQESWAHAHETLSALRAQPYFKEHEADIKAALEAHEEWGDNVHAAYNHVLVTKILPTLSRAEQQQVIGALTGKTAGTTVTPGGAAPAAPKFKSFKDAAQYYEQHPEEAASMAKR